MAGRLLLLVPTHPESLHFQTVSLNTMLVAAGLTAGWAR
jgi:hypothetical protein